MKDLHIGDPVVAIYDFGHHEEHDGVITRIDILVTNNIAARVYTVEMDNGITDSFSEGYLIPIEYQTISA